MGMWIRSQNNMMLLKAKNILCIKEELDDTYVIYDDVTDYILGKYSTEEKVIRVFDMIEDSIKWGKKVFQMPADEEVEE